MDKTKLGERFFESTRGRIVSLLRGETLTVNELAEQLQLTDNAVRAHLLTLERDGLIKQSGVRRGFRKPHFSYKLTHEAEALFPKAYDRLLNALIKVLQERLDPKAVADILRQVGRSLAARQSSVKGSLENRARGAVKALEALGGSARIEKEENKLIIRSGSCPLAAAVSEHPEVCQLAEALMTEIVGTRVIERCDRNGPPQCRFEIRKTV
ncbi:MAG TPA: ArsR family transcriptional regulator [Pyrinomonadaceae bacterium]|nr:ArsR family transcriptional regulator [Pyrinomonadaceae bacterium]